MSEMCCRQFSLSHIKGNIVKYNLNFTAVAQYLQCKEKAAWDD